MVQSDRTGNATAAIADRLPPVPEGKPVLIAGPTASGKSALALAVAERFGGVIVNADASQVYDCWRVISARPSAEEEARAPHALYGHVPFDETYSAGQWLREVTPLLSGDLRPIIVGGTGLYFKTLTEGMAEIPPTPAAIRAQADAMPLPDLLAEVDPRTRAGLDTRNRARVQRAWEAERATGRSLADWQAETPPPVLRLDQAVPIVVDVDKAWLLDRINRRFAAFDGIDVLHTINHFTPDRILAIQPVPICKHDEELGIGAVRVCGPGHAEDAALERRVAELGLDVGKVRTAHAGSGRIARLGHETVDHAMEDDAVIKTVPGQLLDALHMRRRQVGPQLDGHTPILGVQIKRVFRIKILGGCERRQQGQCESQCKASQKTRHDELL